MSPVVIVEKNDDFEVDKLEKGKVHRLQIELSDNSIGRPWKVPVVVVRGHSDGPMLGLTAALHGNELNGISTISPSTG